MSETKVVSSGTNILGLLGILFVGLKLAGVIAWSWWYVTMPFWLGITLVISIFLILILFGLIKAMVNK